MPEISEYHAIKKKLDIEEEIITSIKLSKNFYKHINKSDINYNALKNSKIEKMIVYGKNIFFYFKKSKNLIIMQSKLGMSGVWIIDQSVKKNKKNYHMIIKTTNHILEYYDPRMFGKIYLFKNKEIKDIILEQNLGIDLLNYKSLDTVFYKIKKSNRLIKTLLLDQSIVAGLGNYLVCEILFESKINPFKKGSSLNDKEIATLIKNSIKIIKESIRKDGVSFDSSYFLPNGASGRYQNKLKVYLNKKNCFFCNSLIKKEYINKRVTYFCPSCQNI